MAKLYVNDKLYLLAESIQDNPLQFPKFADKAIISHKHSLGDNDVFPELELESFESLILHRRYDEIIKNLQSMYPNVTDIKELMSELSKVIKEIMTIEKGHENELLELAVMYLDKVFHFQRDVNLSMSLGETGSIKGQLLYPENKEYVFKNNQERRRLVKEVYKRRVLNALVQGIATRISEDIRPCLNGIYEINPRLPELYHKLNVLNTAIAFITPDSENISNAGMVEVNLSNETPKIKAYGLVFPILVFEITRGLLEILTAQALPKDNEQAKYVLNMSDFLMAENWDLRLGVPMWDIIGNLIGESDFKYDIVSDLFKLDCDEFNETLSEIFGETQSGKATIEKLQSLYEEESEFDSFNERILTKRENFCETF